MVKHITFFLSLLETINVYATKQELKKKKIKKHSTGLLIGLLNI